MNKIMLIINLFLLVISHQSCANEKSVAMITALTGNTFTVGKSLGLFAELQVNANLELTDHSKVTLVLYQNGKEYVLDGPGQAQITADSVNVNGKPLSGNTLLVSTDGLNLSPKDVEQAAIIMRGGLTGTKQTINIIYPRGSKLLETGPIFKWEAPGQGYKYRLEIFNHQSQSIFVTETDQTQFSLPNQIKLPTEQLLTWEVEASKGAEVLFNSADFIVASPELVERIMRQKPDSNASPSRIALYIKILNNFSFKHEAEKYKSLLKQD